MTEPHAAPRGELTLRTLAMPADVNVSGDIVGGTRAQGRVATVAIDAMKFIRRVHVGDVLCIYAEVARVGRTSMGIALEAWVLRGRYGAREKVT